ncbi:MAG: hypothetical protein IKX36_03340 [Prevotella sp.]|nr:hypothetical protein [Prevotella sp.]
MQRRKGQRQGKAQGHKGAKHPLMCEHFQKTETNYKILELSKTEKRVTSQKRESFPIQKYKLLIASDLTIINSKKVFQNEQLTNNYRIFAKEIKR